MREDGRCVERSGLRRRVCPAVRRASIPAHKPLHPGSPHRSGRRRPLRELASRSGKILRSGRRKSYGCRPSVHRRYILSPCFISCKKATFAAYRGQGFRGTTGRGFPLRKRYSVLLFLPLRKMRRRCAFLVTIQFKKEWRRIQWKIE